MSDFPVPQIAANYGDEPTYTLVMTKEDFKFSSAHFTLFSAHEAELLHGHNYRVGVEFHGRALDEELLLVSFIDVKRVIRALCEELDTRTLLPIDSPHLTYKELGDHLEIRFLQRRYVMPTADALMLPMRNTSIEGLARYLWQRLAVELDVPNLDGLGVSVAETDGQSCWYRARLG